MANYFSTHIKDSNVDQFFANEIFQEFSKIGHVRCFNFTEGELYCYTNGASEKCDKIVEKYNISPENISIQDEFDIKEI